MEDPLYVDENCLTIGQFIKCIEANDTIPNDEDKKLLAIHQLTDNGKKFVQPHLKKNWKSLKKLLLNKFKSKLTLIEKINLRRHLKQRENESCEQFHARCVKWQFLLFDDQVDSVFEKDILINFVSGLKEDIYNKLVLEENISDLNFCVKLAIQIEQDTFEDKKPNIIHEEISDKEISDLDYDINAEEISDNQIERIKRSKKKGYFKKFSKKWVLLLLI